MAELFKTKYPNNSRVISGVATIYRDDVVLLCDTSVAPVTINLFDIPDNFWSTQWKLYIIDNSNNASVNNIIINAGVGQLINGQPTITLNTNGSAALVQIISNNNFIGNLTFISGGGGGGGYATIQDEGVALPQRTTLDFVGEFVEATDNGVKTISTVNPKIKDILHADLLTAIANGTLVKGLFYRIIDPTYAVNVTVMAIETNKIQLQGAAEWCCADYNNIGDYSGIIGFNSQLGIWSPFLTPINNDVVIWNNLHWRNNTGINTNTPPNLDLVNWSLLPKDIAFGYVYYVFTVDYNFVVNRPDRVYDVFSNIVDYADPKGQNSFDNFPFGNSVVTNNTIIGSEVIVGAWMNVRFEICRNNYVNGGLIQFDTAIGLPTHKITCIQNNINRGELQFGGFIPADGVFLECNTVNSGVIQIINNNQLFNQVIVAFGNHVNGGGLQLGQVGAFIGDNPIFLNENFLSSSSDQLRVDEVDTTLSQVRISANTLSNGCSIRIGRIERVAQFRENELKLNGFFFIPLLNDNNSQGGIKSVLSESLSTFKKILDFSDPTVYDPTTLTLDLGTENYVGIYLCEATNFGNVENITNGQTIFPFRLEPAQDVNIDLVFVYTTIISVYNTSLSNKILKNGELVGQTRFKYYGEYRDNITFIRKTNLDIGGATRINNFVLSSQKMVN